MPRVLQVASATPNMMVDTIPPVEAITTAVIMTTWMLAIPCTAHYHNGMTSDAKASRDFEYTLSSHRQFNWRDGIRFRA